METNKEIQKPWWRDGVVVFVKVSSYIAFPVILGSILGKYLDEKYSTNYIFYISVGIAFITTVLLIWKELKNYKKKLEQETKKN